MALPGFAAPEELAPLARALPVAPVHLLVVPGHLKLPLGGRRNLLVYALDYELGSSLLFHLEAYQHTLTGYFGAGLGFATPTTPGGLQGVSLGLLLGIRYPLGAVGEAVFPTAEGRRPELRLAPAFGLDLYP